MECQIHKCEISMLCLALECMCALCYKCLLKHNQTHESQLFECKKIRGKKVMEAIIIRFLIRDNQKKS